MNKILLKVFVVFLLTTISSSGYYRIDHPDLWPETINFTDWILDSSDPANQANTWGLGQVDMSSGSFTKLSDWCAESPSATDVWYKRTNPDGSVVVFGIYQEIDWDGYASTGIDGDRNLMVGVEYYASEEDFNNGNSSYGTYAWDTYDDAVAGTTLAQLSLGGVLIGDKVQGGFAPNSTSFSNINLTQQTPNLGTESFRKASQSTDGLILQEGEFYPLFSQPQ